MKNHLTLVPFQGGRPVFWPFLWFFLSCSTATLLFPCGKVCDCCTGSVLSVCLLLSSALSQSLLGLLSAVLTFPVPALTSTLKFSFSFTGKLTPSLPQENPTLFSAVNSWQKALLSHGLKEKILVTWKQIQQIVFSARERTLFCWEHSISFLPECRSSSWGCGLLWMMEYFSFCVICKYSARLAKADKEELIFSWCSGPCSTLPSPICKCKWWRISIAVSCSIPAAEVFHSQHSDSSAFLPLQTSHLCFILFSIWDLLFGVFNVPRSSVWFVPH